MSDEPLYTLNQAARALGRPWNHGLFTAMIRQHNIKTRTVGRAIVLNEKGLSQLRRALEAWDNRPRLSRMRAAATA